MRSPSILFGGHVDEDAGIDPEIACQDANVPRIEPTSAQQNLRQRRLGQSCLRGDGRPQARGC
jgi:hypothetical protein